MANQLLKILFILITSLGIYPLHATMCYEAINNLIKSVSEYSNVVFLHQSIRQAGLMLNTMNTSHKTAGFYFGKQVSVSNTLLDSNKVLPTVFSIKPKQTVVEFGTNDETRNALILTPKNINYLSIDIGYYYDPNVNFLQLDITSQMAPSKILEKTKTYVDYVISSRFLCCVRDAGQKSEEEKLKSVFRAIDTAYQILKSGGIAIFYWSAHIPETDQRIYNTELEALEEILLQYPQLNRDLDLAYELTNQDWRNSNITYEKPYIIETISFYKTVLHKYFLKKYNEAQYSFIQQVATGTGAGLPNNNNFILIIRKPNDK